MSSLPLGAGNSPSFPSQIRQERLGEGEAGEYLDRERERDEQKWEGGGAQGQGVVMRSKPPQGAALTSLAQHAFRTGRRVVAADDGGNASTSTSEEVDSCCVSAYFGPSLRMTAAPTASSSPSQTRAAERHRGSITEKRLRLVPGL